MAADQRAWRTLEQWMASRGLGTCARPFLLGMDNVHSLDVTLPTDAGTISRLRTVSKPEKPLAVLLAKLGINIPQTPKQLENVVQKTSTLLLQRKDLCARKAQS